MHCLEIEISRALVVFFPEEVHKTKVIKKRLRDNPEPFSKVSNFRLDYCLNSTRRFITRPSSVELSAIGLVSPEPLVLIRRASTPELTK
jgi:hypothetical protein